MKKYFLLLLALVMLVSLTACGKNSEKESIGVTESPGMESQPSESRTQSSGETTGSENNFTQSSHIHSYTQSKTAPDCTNGGYTTNTCVCGDSYRSDETAALGHRWTDATCTVPKTCSVCKATEGTAKGHSWTETTCTAPKTCSVCKATEGAAKGHSWTEATCAAPKTCQKCGETEGDAVGHNWKNATCTAVKTCEVCGATEGGPRGHQWNSHGVCQVCDSVHDEYVQEYEKLTEEYITKDEDLDAQIAALNDEIVASNEKITQAQLDRINLYKKKNAYISQKTYEYLEQVGSSTMGRHLAEEDWKRYSEFMELKYAEIVVTEQSNIEKYNADIARIEKQKNEITKQYNSDVKKLIDKYL